MSHEHHITSITMRKTLLAAAILSSVVPLLASSYYPARLDDPKAIYLTQENFAVKGDGIADDSAVLQQAINQIQEKTNQGILFVPAGRYRLTRTIYIWPGIRLIGYRGDASRLCARRQHSGFSAWALLYVVLRGSLRARAPEECCLRRTPARARSIPQSAISILKFKTEIPALWASVPTMPSIVFSLTWIFTSARDSPEFTMVATSRKTCIFTGASTASGPGSPPLGGNSQLSTRRLRASAKPPSGSTKPG